MPTKLPRHTITETPKVREALDRLRGRGEPVSLPDLVVRGVDATLADLAGSDDEEARKAALRKRHVERLRSGDGIDVDAALWVREHGWTRVEG